MCTICVLHVFLILISANVGYTLQFLPVQQFPQKKIKVLRISAKLKCLTGCEKTAPTGTKQTTYRGQRAQHTCGKL